MSLKNKQNSILLSSFHFFQNLIRTKKLGVSEGVDYLTLNTKDLKNVLLKILQNESYAQNAKKWSARFRDQKEKPLDRAVWWIEWIIRNPHCDYLRSPVNELGFIVGNAHDIIACITLISTFLTVLFVKICFYCIKKILYMKKQCFKHKKME